MSGRITLNLTALAETGEGKINKASEAKIRTLMKENPLLAADILKDWCFDLDCLYEEARAGFWTKVQS